MSYTPTQDSFRVESIDHSASIPDPIGGSIDEAIGYVKARPGTRIAPATAMDSYDLAATARAGKAFNPITRGTKDDLVFVVFQIGQGTASITCADMLAGAFKGNMNTKPHEWEQAFEYDSADSENLDPISVS
jgi:hypothetical protein